MLQGLLVVVDSFLLVSKAHWQVLRPVSMLLLGSILSRQQVKKLEILNVPFQYQLVLLYFFVRLSIVLYRLFSH